MQLTQKFYFVIILLLLSLSVKGASQDSTEEHLEKENEFNAIDMIMHHVLDANEWHLFTLTDKHGHEEHYTIPLPVIIWDGELKMFMSSKLSHGSEYKGFGMKHGTVYSLEGKTPMKLLDLFSTSSNKYIDLSITKNVLAMLFSVLLILFIFIGIAKSYTRNQLRPRGLAAFFEPVIIFVRDEIAIPNIGKQKYEKFLPYLLTIFFFIWINNLLGLIPIFPAGANLSGNIGMTIILALFTFVIVTLNGNKNYWRHIYKTPGVPVLLLPIMIPIEIIGMFTKPFALLMRLFANITAGHIMLLSLISLIFIFKTTMVGIGVVPVALFISILELLVALLQAYIFTILSALFIGLAVAEKH